MSDDQRRHPPGSHARTGGNARPVPPRRSTRQPEQPPSFTPDGTRPRPGSGPPPVVVGRPAPPTAAPGRAMPGRPAAVPPGSRAPAPGSRPPAPPTGTRRPTARQGAPDGPPASRPPTAVPRRRRRLRRTVLVLALLLALAIAWPLGLAVWANGKIQHVAALSGTPDTTPGTTYLLAGSDARGDGGLPEDGTLGARTDTIMVLHDPPSGPTALISLPRDTYTEIPGHGSDKLNAAYVYGGAALLVQTVEGLTGMHIDHYAEIGLGGVAQIVDAVGGVELCMDPAVNKVNYPVNDPESGMVWDAPGCKVVDGPTSLTFARMRKADLEGDIGRAKRQQQLIASVASTVVDPSLLWRPNDQVSLLDTGLGAITVSEGTNILDMGRLALAFRDATGPGGIRGTPPIASIDYRPGGVGSAVLLDPEATPGFWVDIQEGSLPPGLVGGVPG